MGHNISENYLLFIGGLGDGFFTVPYVQQLLVLIGWNIIEVLISSSYKGWGTGSVTRQVVSCEHHSQTAI
jgi:predicted acetyltransferase